MSGRRLDQRPETQKWGLGVVVEDSWRAEFKIVLIAFQTKSCLWFQSPVVDPVAVGPLPVIPRQACSCSKVKVLDSRPCSDGGPLESACNAGNVRSF